MVVDIADGVVDRHAVKAVPGNPQRGLALALDRVRYGEVPPCGMGFVARSAGDGTARRHRAGHGQEARGQGIRPNNLFA